MESFISKIFKSSVFADHAHYEDLFRYLIACSLKNETPKEISIAIEIFGRKNDYDPANDSTVRVYIHNLRKKLQDYYQNPQLDGKVLFIPYKNGSKEFWVMELDDDLEEIASKIELELRAVKWMKSEIERLLGYFTEE